MIDVKTLKGSIKSGCVPKFLIFLVEDSAFARQYIEAISNAIRKSVSYYTTADEVLYDCGTGIIEDRLFVITYDNKVLENEKYIEALKDTDKNIVVLFNDIDNKKYKKFISAQDKFIVRFAKLDTYSLISYAEIQCKSHAISIEQDKIKKLIEYCNNDFGCLKNELNKIILLNLDKPEFLNRYIEQDGFSDYRKGDTETLLQKILNNEVNDTFVYYNKFNDTCDNTIMLLYKLYSSARTMFVKTGKNYYARIIYLINEVYTMVIDGTLKENTAFNYFLVKLWS